jgi:hypothetical protein
VPPENLVVQGYGEDFLKVPTVSAEPLNRHATIRRITPLLQTRSQVSAPAIWGPAQWVTAYLVLGPVAETIGGAVIHGPVFPGANVDET